MSNLLLRAAVCLSMLAVISSSLYAVDGVVLIDQNRALAGNVTPGDTPGFPVTISQPGSYRLSGNLTVTDSFTTAVHITADYVTFDLNGFSINGPNVCTPNPTTCTFSGGGVGVHAGDFQATGIPAPKGVTVMNGTVRGMGFHGVRLIGDSTTVERVRAIGNGGPGIVVGAGSVIDCTAYLNGGTTAIIAFMVRGSVADRNRAVGIFVRDNGLASDNLAYSNGSHGFQAGKATLTGNTANSNAGFGMSVTCPSAIINNTTVGNQLGGVQNLGQGVFCTFGGNAQ